MKRSAPIQACGNPFEDRARALKAQKLALILWEAGARRAADVWALGPEGRAAALELLGPDGHGPAGGLGAGGRARAGRASESTWRAVASLVGYLGGGSGGRRRCATVPSRLEVDDHGPGCDGPYNCVCNGK